MNTSSLSDPTKFGPGVWFFMHTLGIMAPASFPDIMQNLCDNFKCQTCKTHFQHFIDTHPFDRYRYQKGYFRWTWECHNEVNYFLGKEQPDFESAYFYYTNPEVCINCGDHSEHILGQSLGHTLGHKQELPSVLSQYMAGIHMPMYPLQ